MTDKGTILIVDDTLASLRLLADTLKQEGYRVHAAASGELALRSAEAAPPDLVLLDVRMPGIDGFETCRRLKANPLTCNIPLIFLSAVTESDDKVKGFDLGAVDFLSKPFDRNELLARVATHLKLYQLSSRLESLVEQRTLALGESEERFRSMIEQAPEAIFLFDVELNHFVEVNRKALQLTGRSRQELLAGDIESLYGDLPQPDGLPASQTISVNHSAALAGQEVVFERVLRHADGHGVVCEMRLVMLPGKEHRLLRASFVDISARRAAEARINYLAHHDMLTGLANQYSLQQQLQQRMASAQLSRALLAVLVLDLDAFKLINEVRGHQVGDRLLAEVARRIETTLSGQGVAARQGGDEFIILLDGLPTKEHAAAITQQILQVLAAPYLIDGGEIMTSASIGVCLFPDDGEDHLELISKADMAMYQAKSQGGQRYAFFDESLKQQLFNRVQVEADLRTAIKENQFILYYQPQVSLAEGRVTGLEALIRWQHPEKGLIPPNAFIPIAEQTGLITTLDTWSLREACRQLKEWQSAGLADVTVSVNLSAQQFQDSELLSLVATTLSETGLSPEYLDLEITESCAMSSPACAITIMQALTELGVSISIDDFGTGYSSLAYLKQFPIETLKIDRSFVMNIESDDKVASLCDSIAHLAHRLGLRVVAEGVETEEQLKFLVSAACDIVQGYFFSKPLSVANVLPFASNFFWEQVEQPVTYFELDNK
ncbi:two-component system response regulator [Aquipseudomonas guryensis]|uniref:cyclic-guanylate-specific phosphodiesterase n=1 Tax=Aquipseudomonas guryensis TaxID=2759165 RepID=A0A7W4DE12_9GAMM|nr:EAL domain-containing protein [Pseudomonas guryensis]MBB1520860.1 EAL domain-containing protein [Pseudomonas guryensis]